MKALSTRPASPAPRACRSPSQPAERGLPDLLLNVLRGGLDFDSAVAHPGLVARLGKDSRAVDNLAATQVEAGVVQVTDYGVALAVARFERAGEVVTRGGYGADLPGRRATKQDPHPFDLDPAQVVLRQLALTEEGNKLIGPGFLEDVPVHPQPVVVGEFSTEMGGHATDGVPRQKGQAPGIPAPRSPEDERDDAKDEPDRVQKPVRHSHPPRSSTQVPPVGEAGHGGSERSQRPEDMRGVGRVPYGLLPGNNVESIEDERRSPTSHRYVREGRVQRRLEPDAVEHIARRRAARVDELLHLRLNVLGDVVQEGQCFDHALHKGLCHLFNLSLGIAARMEVCHASREPRNSRYPDFSAAGSGRNASAGFLVTARRAIQCAIRIYK